MDEDDPYESLPPETPTHYHMMAGSVAGVAEHCLMYPVDVVKTRMMCIKGNPETQYKSITGALRTMIRQEGWSRPVRGVSAVFVGAGPAHAMYFAGYEKIKRELTIRLTKGKPGESPLANALAGGCATLLHDAVMNPAEVVKQRMQMFQSPYRNCRDCILKIYHSEGVRAFYRSYTTALSMNIPFQVTHFVTYEKMQDFTNRDRQYNPWTHMVSGGLAGGAAAAVTTPMDVCRTLLNTQQGLCAVPHCAESPAPGGPGLTLNNTRTAKVTGMFQAVRIVYVTNGVGGFFKGLKPRVIYQMPATAISWACYESFKHFLIRKDDDGDGGHGASPSSSVSDTLTDSNKVVINVSAASGTREPPSSSSSSAAAPLTTSPSSTPHFNISTPPSTTSGPHSILSSELAKTTVKTGLPLPGSKGGMHVCAASTSDGVLHFGDEGANGEKLLDSNSVSSSKCRSS